MNPLEIQKINENDKIINIRKHQPFITYVEKKKSNSEYIIIFLILVSYLTSFLSITNNHWQPSLISLTIWVTNGLGILSATSYFGYHHIYYLQGNEETKLQNFFEDLDKEDLFEYTGYIFISSLSVSLLSFFLSKIYNKILFFKIFSWVLVLFSVITYSIGFYNTMYDELHSSEYDLFDWNIRPGFGLVTCLLNLLLIPFN